MKRRFFSAALFGAILQLGTRGLAIAQTSGTSPSVISNPDELMDALQRAAGGEEFRLAGGNYGALKLTQRFRTPVRIRSDNPQDPAYFSSVQVNGGENVVFDHVVFRYTYEEGDDVSTRKFELLDSRNIKIQNSFVLGGTNPRGYPNGWGIIVARCSGIEIRNTEIATWIHGIKMGECQDVAITNCNIHDISGNGLQIRRCENISFENNYVHDFTGDPDSDIHRDMLQVFSRGEPEPTTGLTIRNNTFDVGAGIFTQTIFLRNEEVDEGRAGSEMFYRNIVIENNVIYNTHVHGITVGATHELSIRNNSVIRASLSQDEVLNQNWADEGNVTIPAINVADQSTSVRIESNIAASFPNKTGKDWTMWNNVIIQDSDPGAGGYYDSLFVYHAKGPSDGYNQYGVRPGSTVDRQNAGSTIVDTYPHPPR